MSRKKRNEQALYKGKCLIAFYKNDDDTFVAEFDNVWEIMKYKKLAMTDNNRKLVAVEVCNALRRENHTTRMLDGTRMRVYLIDTTDDDV